MSNNIYNTEIHNVCLQCPLQNGVIVEDIANNNWDEESSDTLILGPCIHQQQEQYKLIEIIYIIIIQMYLIHIKNLNLIMF